jgi:hypothetical protein
VAGYRGFLLLSVMTPDEVTVAEYDGGIRILSVVRPVGDTEAEHVFQIRRGDDVIGEADTMVEAAAMAEDKSRSADHS